MKVIHWYLLALLSPAEKKLPNKIPHLNQNSRGFAKHTKCYCFRKKKFSYWWLVESDLNG